MFLFVSLFVCLNVEDTLFFGLSFCKWNTTCYWLESMIDAVWKLVVSLFN